MSSQPICGSCARPLDKHESLPLWRCLDPQCGLFDKWKAAHLTPAEVVKLLGRDPNPGRL
jgi:ribosomal protein L37AE/L43A